MPADVTDFRLAGKDRLAVSDIHLDTTFVSATDDRRANVVVNSESKLVLAGLHCPGGEDVIVPEHQPDDPGDVLARPKPAFNPATPPSVAKKRERMRAHGPEQGLSQTTPRSASQ